MSSEKVVENIKIHGKDLGFGWYFLDKYYHIQEEKNKSFIRLMTNDLIIDIDKGYYIAPFNGGITGSLVFIKGFEMLKPGVFFKDIEILDNGFYIVKNTNSSTEENQSSLNYIGKHFTGISDVILFADRITPIKSTSSVSKQNNNLTFVVESNNVKYIVKVDYKGYVISSTYVDYVNNDVDISELVYYVDDDRIYNNERKEKVLI